MSEKTLGQERIGKDDVFSEIIDIVDEEFKNPVDANKARWKALCLTAIEEAAVWYEKLKS